MEVLYFLLLLGALVCFLLSAFFAQRVEGARATTVNLVALGLALWVAVPFIQMAQRL